MNAKKIAVRGLIALAAVVALCMFFSGTIRTIATAKVKIAQCRQGKLTQTVELKSELNFPVSDEVFIEGGADVTIDVKSVKVDVGYEVEEGDVIFEGAVSDFDKTMEQYRETYKETQASLQALLDKDIRLKRTEEAWAEAYQKYSAANDLNLDASLAFKAGLKVEGLSLTAGGELPEEASDELKALFTASSQAASALADAKKAMDDAERYAISDETRSYITDKIKYERQLAQTEESMLDLTVLNRSVKSVTAKSDGYITAVNVKAGETFAASGAAYRICPKDEMPTLRADITECELTISKKMDAYLTDKDGDEIESKVVAVGVTLTGGKYADIDLDKGIVKDMGGMYALASSDVTVKVEYKAQQATTLLPSAAVRGSGTDRYVYTLRTQESSFGTQKTVLEKQTVTVLAEADGTVSISEDLSYMQIAYMEDRSVTEGDSVMEYTN